MICFSTVMVNFTQAVQWTVRIVIACSQFNIPPGLCGHIWANIHTHHSQVDQSEANLKLQLFMFIQHPAITLKRMCPPTAAARFAYSDTALLFPGKADTGLFTIDSFLK